MLKSVMEDFLEELIFFNPFMVSHIEPLQRPALGYSHPQENQSSGLRDLPRVTVHKSRDSNLSVVGLVESL